MEASKLDGHMGRTIYLDYLRVFATVAVILLHISGQHWYDVDIKSFEWQVFNFFDGCLRWCVPIFVMISGSLFLPRDIPQKKILSKYVLRIAASFIAWSIIYVFFMDGSSIGSRLVALIQGHYHMWFILMISGLYMCIPFIKPITENENRMRYYLVLAFIFAFAIPGIVTLIKDFGNELLIKGANTVNVSVGYIYKNFLMGYASYFVFGHYLNKTDISKRHRMVIYLLGLLGAVLSIVLSLAASLKTQQKCENYYDYFSVNVLLESTAVFVWFKYRKFDRVRLHPTIVKLSKYSFGAYLVHALIIEQLESKLGLNTLSFNAIFVIPVIGVIVTVISFAISALLNHIPVIKKYMV